MWVILGISKFNITVSIKILWQIFSNFVATLSVAIASCLVFSFDLLFFNFACFYLWKDIMQRSRETSNVQPKDIMQRSRETSNAQPNFAFSP